MSRAAPLVCLWGGVSMGETDRDGARWVNPLPVPTLQEQLVSIQEDGRETLLCLSGCLGAAASLRA